MIVRKWVLVLVVVAGSVTLAACETAPASATASASPLYPVVDYPDGGLPVRDCDRPPPWNVACNSSSLDACMRSECEHDIALCRASRYLDYAHSSVAPPSFGLRKKALQDAQDELEYALVGSDNGAPGTRARGILWQLHPYADAFEAGC